MEALIARSGIELSDGFYTPAQAQAITQHVFGVDTQLVADQTYFVIEEAGQLLACGGWSKRATLFGADRTKQGADPCSIRPRSRLAYGLSSFTRRLHGVAWDGNCWNTAAPPLRQAASAGWNWRPRYPACRCTAPADSVKVKHSRYPCPARSKSGWCEWGKISD
jgi:hypothetical protein